MTDGTVLRAVRQRRSRPRVGDEAPSDRELTELLQAAAGAADHASLAPWRIVALRGDARRQLGAALAEAADLPDDAAARLAAKPLRAPLLLAIVLSPVDNPKVPLWEQAATAAGVAHLLSLLLDEQGWGVMWRTGPHTRSAPIRALHQLREGEELLGWLYVGSRLDPPPPLRALRDVTTRLSAL